jgi:hypothetical protein
MRQPKPFLEDGSQFGVSRTQFRQMLKSEKLDAMKDWFFQNFEDPAESTPHESAEGGYQYIWGGPYDAKDELWGKFGTLVLEAWIDEVVNDIEADGQTDWAPVHTGDDYYEQPLDGEKPQPLDEWVRHVPDGPGPSFGTPEDHDARRQTIDALRNAEEVLPSPAIAGIGHNRPPKAIDHDEVTRPDLHLLVNGLRTELENKKPRVSIIKQLTGHLGNVTQASVVWTGHKLDVMFEEAAKSIGKHVGKAVVVAPFALEPHVQHAIGEALEKVVNWLRLVTLAF